MPLKKTTVKKTTCLLLSAIVMGSITLAPMAQAEFFGTEKKINSLPNFADLVETLSPAVVNISTTSKVSGSPMDEFFEGQVPPQFNELFKNFFGRGLQNRGGSRPQREVKSLGSGFVIDASGYVVTNHHVIDKADKIEVNFPDGTSHSAKLIGSDLKTDLALLKIKSDKKFPAVSWGKSAKKRVGEWVLAIGNPYGLNGTVTKGIISALNRDIDSGPYDDFIQTDAAINRGNSGGPLFDLNGNVIGVNTAIISPTGGSVGVGFAIPSDLAENIIDQLKNKGSVERGWIGVSVQPVTKDIADSLGLKKVTGALVGDINSDSPASKGGIQAGDVIIAVSDQEIDKVRDLPRLIAQTPIGSKAKITVMRSGSKKDLYLEIGKYDDVQAKITKKTPTGASFIEDLGMSLQNITPKTRDMYRLSKDVRGVIIEEIKDFTHIGWQKGDVIIEIQRQSIGNVNDFVKKFTHLRKKGQNPILFRVDRFGSQQYYAVRF